MLPTYLHEQAVKCIGRYLATTWGKGLIFHPTDTGTLDMYVDADFVGTKVSLFIGVASFKPRLH
jgi:hypothetical protein